MRLHALPYWIWNDHHSLAGEAMRLKGMAWGALIHCGIIHLFSATVHSLEMATQRTNGEDEGELFPQG